MKIVNLVKSLGLLNLVCLVLGGCASAGSSHFSCPNPQTGMCKPIHDVDKMVSQGQIGSTSVTTVANTSAATNTGASGTFGNFSTPYPAALVTPGVPLRLQEQVMAVWLAPYQDKQGNYHEPSTLYTVIKPGQWAASPVTAVDGDDDDD